MASPAPSESLVLLTGLARARFGKIPPERLALHVDTITAGADWPVKRAAMEALVRRYGFATRDGLHVPARTLRGLGAPVRIAGGSQARAYDTALFSVAPLRASCGCADFVRSSLGLCKHALVLLEAAERAGAKLDVVQPDEARPTLSWDPLVPLLAPDQPLARLRYTHSGRAKPPAGFVDARPADEVLVDPAARLTFVSELLRRISRGALDAEPAVLTLLADERSRAERLSARDARVPLKSLSQLKRKLYPYQREGVTRFFERGRLLLADDMGLGKTTQAIACCHGMVAAGDVKRGLVIVPTALKPQWLREWQATTHVPLTLVEGSPRERARLYADTRAGFLLIGYEQLLRDFADVQRYAPDLVVLDEAQRIKNWATKSAAYVKALAPAYRLVLTGTPMENRFDELASIMDFVDDMALEPKWRLVPLHQIAQANGGKGLGGARHLDVLRARMADVMLRRVRSEVLRQLPARTDTRVSVELTEAQRTRHDELNQPIAELASISSRRPLAQAEFLRLMQLLTTQRMLCNGVAQVEFDDAWPRCENAVATPALLESLFAPKLAVLRGLLEQLVLTQGRKVVVFSQWRKMLRLSAWAVHDVLASAGQRAVFFTGAESPKQRERAIADFHDDPSVSVMFLSDAGGVGLNLQRAASACINLELPWNPAVLEQRIGRIYRLGQTLPIDVYNLVTEDGIEARIARLLGQKKAVFASLFDGTSDSVQFDGQASFMEGVRRLVDPIDVPVLDVEEINAPVEQDPRVEDALAEPEQPTLAGLKIERLPDGGLRVEAPPALAGPLAELLESLASALRAGAKT